MAAGRATGIAVALTIHDQTVWQEGFGWADVEQRKAVTAHTPFSLASLTKPFTATTLMRLVATNKLRLEAPFGSYLNVRDPDGVAYSENASVRLLGAHAAGFPSLFEMFSVAERRLPPSDRELCARYGRLVYAPDTVYEYSNIGYAVLGAIACQVLRQRFGTIMHEQLLGPLGLQDSFFGNRVDRRNDAAVRYDEHRKPIPFYTTATPASGELFASAHDVARFAMFNLKSRKVARSAILGDEHIDEMHRAVFHGEAGGAATFGWFKGRTKAGLDVIVKDGGQPGVSTLCYLVPSERVSCIVLANRTDNGNLVQEIADATMRTLLPDWSPPDALVRTGTTALNASPAFIGHWVGSIRGGGQQTAAELQVLPNGTNHVSLGDAKPVELQDVALRSGALVGTAAGELGFLDEAAAHARSLALKLFPRDGELTGRLLATAESPGVLSSIPFSVNLRRK